MICNNFSWLHRKNHIKIYQTTTSFYSKKDLKLIKNRKFLVKNWENSGNCIMIMLTYSSEMIFNWMSYTGIIFHSYMLHMNNNTQLAINFANENKNKRLKKVITKYTTADENGWNLGEKKLNSVILIQEKILKKKHFRSTKVSYIQKVKLVSS